MKNFMLGIIIGSLLTAVGAGFAADYLHSSGGSYSNEQAIIGEIRIREALETIQMGRQNYLDGQVRDAGKLPYGSMPCR
jgi:hypothetical protein